MGETDWPNARHLPEQEKIAGLLDLLGSDRQERLCPQPAFLSRSPAFFRGKGKALFHKLDVNSSRKISKSVQ